MRAMRRRSIKSRKGIGTAIGTAFFIIIVLMSIVAFWTISGYEIATQNVRQTMTKWDVERISENLNVRNVSQPVSKMSGQKYDVNIIVDNNGGVTVNIARIYVLDQNNNDLNVSGPMNLSATQPRFGFNQSTINTGEVSHIIPVSVTPNLASALSASHKCRIILTTDRGRQFSYTYPPPNSGGAGIGPANIGYLVMTFNPQSLAFTAISDQKHGPPVVISYTTAWHNVWNNYTYVVWHINITNVGSKDVRLESRSKIELLNTYTKTGWGGFALLQTWFISNSPGPVPPGVDYDHQQQPGVVGIREYPDNGTVVHPGQSVWVAFGSSDDSFAGTYPADSGAGHTHYAAIPNMAGDVDAEVWLVFVMHYYYGTTEEYSQIIPFGAITVK
jgi:hypothetical protein